MLEGGLKLPQSFLAYSLWLASRKEPQQHTHSHGEPPTEAAKAATTLSLVLWFDLWFWLLPDSCQAAATPFSWLAHLFQMFHLPLGTCSHSECACVSFWAIFGMHRSTHSTQMLMTHFTHAVCHAQSILWHSGRGEKGLSWRYALSKSMSMNIH